MSEKATETLFILNEGPDRHERSYNALRPAMNLVRESKASVKVFLVGGGVVRLRGEGPA